jgi:hypothetical protein
LAILVDFSPSGDESDIVKMLIDLSAHYSCDSAAHK